MMGGQGYGFGGTWGIVGGIISLLFFLLIIIGVILLIVWIVRQFSHHPAQTMTGSRSLEVLRERYAKGEITKEQFEQMKKDLGG
jgi:putative membrane protein